MPAATTYVHVNCIRALSLLDHDQYACQHQKLRDLTLDVALATKNVKRALRSLLAMPGSVCDVSYTVYDLEVCRYWKFASADYPRMQVIFLFFPRLRIICTRSQ